MADKRSISYVEQLTITGQFFKCKQVLFIPGIHNGEYWV